ncbi:MAG: DUF433 domain-containing protein [Chloroflexota bacterium]
MIADTLQPQILPLTRWEDGSIRIGKTRVLLELVVHAYNEGRSPEEIAISYPTLKLAEIYGAITYYLENQAQINSYIDKRELEAENMWATIEADPNQKQIRARLLSRLNQTNNA